MHKIPSTTSQLSYDPTHFDRLALLDHRHFWFVCRRRAIAAAVRSVVGDLPPGYCLLEVGCGNGRLVQQLTEVCTRGTVIGMDLFSEALEWTRRRSSCPLVRGNIFEAPFAGSVNVAGLFDVLEHLDDDINALDCLRGLMVPGGTLVLTVPAHPALWSYFDEFSHHRRRYTMEELTAKLTKSGFRVQYITEYMCSLLPLIWTGRRLSAMLQGRASKPADEMVDGDLKIIPVLNDVVGWTLAWEARQIENRRQLPFGASILAIARLMPDA